jgi:hypothetical protein
MPTYENFKKGRTLEESLKDSLSNSISNVNTSTSMSGSLLDNSYSNDDDKNMFEGLGSGLWDFTREATEAFVDTALFGIPSAVSDWEPSDDAGDSLGGKIGQGLGGAAGFFVPFMGIGAGVRAAGRGWAGVRSSTAIKKGIDKDVKLFFKENPKAAKYLNIADDTVKSDDIGKSFMDHVLPSLTKPIANFDKAFKTAASKNDFIEQMGRNSLEQLNVIAKAKGFKIDSVATQKALKTIVDKHWAAADNLPISSMAGKVADLFGNSAGANFYGHLAEEAMTFAVVENLIHGIDVAAGEVDADFLGTTAHAVLMGHILGTVRFIPGGVEGGVLGIMRGTAPKRVKRILKESESYAMRYDTTTKEGQKAIYDQYKLLANIKQRPTNGGPIDTVLANRASDLDKTLNPIKQMVDKDFTLAGFTKIMQKKGVAKKTLLEKEKATLLMQDGLRHLNSQINKEWRKDFIKEWGGDLLKSSPRMLIGGVAMSGGPSVLFSDEIEFEDKLISLMTGAFLMKGGKVLKYRDKTSGQFNEWHPMGVRPLKDFESTLIEQELYMDALGVDTTNNPIWSDLVYKAIKDNKMPTITDNMSPNDLAIVEPLFTSIMNGKFIVKDTRKLTEPKEKSKGSVGGEWADIFNQVATHLSHRSILGEGKRIQQWKELTLKKKELFVKQMTKLGIDSSESIHEMFLDANNKNLLKLDESFINALNNGESALGGFNASDKGADGRYKYKQIVFNGNFELTTEQKVAIQQYNALRNLAAKSGEIAKDQVPFVIDKNFEKSKMDNFFATMKTSKENTNEILELNDIQRQFDYDSPFFHDAMDQLHLSNAIKLAAEKLPVVWNNMDSDSSTRFRKILRTKDGLAIPASIKVKGSPTKTIKINEILKTVRKIDTSKGKIDTGAIKGAEKTITTAEASEVLKTLKENGIHAFDTIAQTNKIPIDVIGKHVSIRWQKNVLKDAFTSDGKRKLDATDRQILQLLENFGITQDYTLRPTVQVMYSMKIDNVMSRVKAEGIDKVIDTLSKSNLQKDKNTAQVLEGLRKEAKETNVDVESLATKLLGDLNATVELYIKNPKTGGGVLNESPTETTGLALDTLSSLISNIEFARSGELKSGALRFISELQHSPEREFSKEFKSVTKEILEMMGPSPKEASVQDMYNLAVEYGVWNRRKNEFNSDLSTNELVVIRQNMFEAHIRKFTNSEKEVAELLEQLTKDKAAEPGETYSVKMGDILAKYDAGTFNKDSSNPLNHLKQIQSKFLQDYNSNIDLFVRDFKREVLNSEKNKALQKPPDATDVHMAAQQYILQQLGSTEIVRLTVNAQGKNNWIRRDDTIQKTYVTDSIMEATGIKNLRIVDSSGIDKNGYKKSLSDVETADKIAELGYQGDYWLNRDAMDKDSLSKQGNNERFVMYSYGDTGYSFAIPLKESTLKQVGNTYANMLVKKSLDKNVPNYDKNNLAKDLKDNNIETITDKDGNVTYELKMSDSWKLGRENMHRIMNDITFDKVLGNVWWTDVRLNLKKESGAKLLKRISLFNNISATRFNQKTIKELVKSLERKIKPVEFKDKADVIKQLKGLSNGKWNQVIVSDESVADGGIDVFHSVNAQVKADFIQTEVEFNTRETALNKIIKGGTTKVEARQKAEKQLDKLTKQREQSVKDNMEYEQTVDDASDVNGVSLVGPEQFKAIAYLSGDIDAALLGGIKPIVLNVGGQKHFYVNKTAFIKNKQLNKLFKLNPELAWITFTSASKKIGKDYHAPVMEAKELFANQTVDSKYFSQITPESLQIVSVKGDKKFASLSANHPSHMQSRAARKALWNARYDKELQNDLKEVSKLKTTAHTQDTMALFKYLTQDRINHRASEMQDMLEQEAIMDALARNDVLPHIMARAWENMVKTEYIDKHFKKKIKNGGQAVMAPDYSPTGANLKNTIVVGNEIYQIGEAELGFTQKFKSFEKDRLQFKEARVGENDKIWDISELSKDKQDAINKNWNLGQLTDWAFKNKLWVMGAGERNPITKPSSVMPFAIKGFRAKSEGNIIVLNAVDVKRAAEGDFDIDTMNFFWDNPFEAMKEYSRGRAEVQDSIIEKVPDKNQSWADLDVNSAESVLNYKGLMAKAEFLRGSIMNSQRIAQFFQANLSDKNSHTSYSKAETDKGFDKEVKLLFKMPGDNRYLTLRGDINVTNQRIANLNQRILDASNGFDVTLFKDLDTVYNDIFFHKKHGLFQVAFKQKVTTTKKGISSDTYEIERVAGEISTSERSVINELLINPYRKLLGLSNKIYEQGKARKVGLRDLVSGAEEFNSDMMKANREAKRMFRRDDASVEKDLDVFAGFNKYAMLTNTNKDTGSYMVHDRLISNIMKVPNALLNKTKVDATSDIEYEKEIDMLVDSSDVTQLKQDAYEGVIENIRSHRKRARIATAMLKKIQRLEKSQKHSQNANGYINKDSNDFNTHKQNNNTLEKLRFAHKSLLNSIKIDKIDPKALSMIKERAFTEALFKAKRDNKFKPLTEEQMNSLRKKVDKDLDNRPETGFVESARGEDVVNSLAMIEGFGYYSLGQAQLQGESRSAYAALEFGIRDLKRDYHKAWKKYMGTDDITWVNEKHIINKTFEDIDNLLDNVESPQMRNWAISRIMTPELDMTKLIEYNGQFYPAPKTKGMSKFINLGLSYVLKSESYTDAVSNSFIRGIGDAYSRTYKKMHNGTDSLRRLDAEGVDVESTFYFEPFEYSKGHGQRELIGALSPGALRAGMGRNGSQLDMYQKLQQTWGSGMIRDIANNTELTQMPIALVAGSRAYALGGIRDLHVALEQGPEKAFLFDRTQEGINILDASRETFGYDTTPIGTSRDAKTPSESTADRVKKLTKEFCD